MGDFVQKTKVFSKSLHLFIVRNKYYLINQFM